MASFIPVYEPTLGGNEEAYVLDCVRTGWISSAGKYVEAFEKEFAAWSGAKHAVALSNGTTAIHVALLALGIGEGDEVIIPDFTLIVSANMTLLTGARPVAVDVDPETFCIDPAKVAEAVTPKTKAIMAVHMYGHPADLKALRKICEEHDLKLIVDAAQGHGVEIDGARASALGDVTCYSFYGNKVLTTGEGGMCLTDDADAAEHMRLLRNQGHREPRFVHDVCGFNYRLTNVQAAIGLAQVERADALVAAKRKLARRYLESLADVECLQLPVERPWATSVYWMFSVVLSKAAPERSTVCGALKDAGIGTRPFFHPMTLQPALEGRLGKPAETPVSAAAGARGFYLPSSTGLSEEQIERVVGELKAALAPKR